MGDFQLKGDTGKSTWRPEELPSSSYTKTLHQKLPALLTEELIVVRQAVIKIEAQTREAMAGLALSRRFKGRMLRHDISEIRSTSSQPRF